MFELCYCLLLFAKELKKSSSYFGAVPNSFIVLAPLPRFKGTSASQPVDGFDFY